MKKEISQNNVTELFLKIDSAAEIQLAPSESNEMTISCSYESNNLIFDENRDGNKYRLKISDPSERITSFFLLNNFLSDFCVKDLIKDISKLQKSESYNLDKNLSTKLKIKLPADVKSFRLKLNNGNLIMNNLSLEFVEVNGNNIKIESGDRMEIIQTKYFLNNCKLKHELNNFTKMVKIESNNSGIKLYRNDYMGIITHNGNNSKKSGSFCGNIEQGKVMCITNNSKIKVKEIRNKKMGENIL